MSERTKASIDSLTMQQLDILIALLEARAGHKENEYDSILQDIGHDDLCTIANVIKIMKEDYKGGETE